MFPIPRASALGPAAVASCLALLATTCARARPASAPAPPPPAEAADAAPPSWVIPEVPLVQSRAVILLAPPARAPGAAAIRAIAPDPPPMVERDQWTIELRYDRGDLFLVGVHKTTLDEPRTTPRVMGRFALELYSGPTLIERVRFDFPGLATADAVPAPDGGTRPLHAPVSFAAKLTTRVGVMLPATTRGTRLELWDRATDQRRPLPWPAVETASEGLATDDGGT